MAFGWSLRPLVEKMSVRRRTQKYKDGSTSTRWVVDVKFRHPDGRVERVRQVARVQSRVGAERLERQIIAELEGDVRPSGAEVVVVVVPTLSEFWLRFHATHVVVNNKPSERHTKERIMAGHLLPAFGKRRLDQIETADIEGYKARMTGLGYKPKTINNHLAVLKTILRAAVGWKVVRDGPSIKLLRVIQKDVVFLDFGEAKSLIAAAQGVYRAMIELALNTGLRIGELLAVQWEDVSKEERMLRVTRTDWLGQIGSPKSGKPRSIPLNLGAVRALEMLGWSDAGLVFASASGEALKYRASNYAIERVAKDAGLTGVGWHTLRHTFASHLVMRGVGLTAVQQLLGHSTQAMTERYAHLTPRVREEAVAALD